MQPGERAFQFWAATLAPSLEPCGLRKASLAVCLHRPGPRGWTLLPATALRRGSLLSPRCADALVVEPWRAAVRFLLTVLKQPEKGLQNP